MKSYFIYRLLDKNNTPIYIGKTNNMDNRFFYEDYSHFSSGTHLPDECYKEIGSIEYIEFDNESEQVIYEATLINKVRPKYNRQFVDLGKIEIKLPDFNWNVWQHFTDEVKLYLKRRTDKSQSMQECFSLYFNEIDSRENEIIKTGFSCLDKAMLIKGSNLILLASVQGIGKTAFALNICNHLLKNGKKVLLCNLKDSNENTMLKMISSECEVPYQYLATGRLEDNHWTKIARDVKYIENANLFFNNNYFIEDIVTNIGENNYDFIIVDDISVIKNKRNTYSKDKVYDILKELKTVSMVAECPILLLSQISMQKVEHRKDKRPMLIDLDYDSYVNFCDSIIFLYRQDMYDPDALKKGLMEVNIAKNKYGTAIEELIFIPKTMTVANIYKGELIKS